MVAVRKLRRIPENTTKKKNPKTPTPASSDEYRKIPPCENLRNRNEVRNCPSTTTTALSSKPSWN
jgi:hypothetical protein